LFWANAQEDETMRTQRLLPMMAACALTGSAAFAQSAAEPARQSNRQAATPVTLVGCIQREADYRKTHDLGRGGTAGTGIGRGNEYVLINASRNTTAPANLDCSFEGTPEAYELTGGREPDLAPYVGKVVQISGTMKEAKTEALPSGQRAPTGGFDPLKGDLRLFEVEVASFQPAPSVNAQAAPAPAPAPAAPAAVAPAPAAQPPQQVARAELPQTASPIPLAGLAGLLSLAGALGLRGFRR
jgi:hypothetical protein